MSKIPSTFLSAVASTDLDHFKQQYNPNNIVWETLRKVLESKLEAKRKELEDPSLFDVLGWKGKEQHLKGQIYNLRQLISLLPDDNGA